MVTLFPEKSLPVADRWARKM